MNFLIDYNLVGHAEILLGNLASQGWLDLLPVRFVTFKEMNLEHPDFANMSVGAKHSGNRYLLLTNNLSAGMLRPHQIGMLP